MAVDKPTIHLSLTKVRADAIKPEPYKVGISGSKVITFPDLFAMESTEAEELFDRVNDGVTKNWVILKEWLSAKDCAALKAEKLTLHQLGIVIHAARDYYEAAYGDSGNA